MSPEKWHRDLAQIIGELSMRITKRTLSRKSMRDWSVTLRRVAAEMDGSTGTSNTTSTSSDERASASES